MALISCPECTHQVSDFASSCPSCGCPIRDSSRPSGSGTAVVVSDFDMSFGKMVTFMVKASIAVIPAVIILFLIVFALAMVFGVWGSIIGAGNP